MPTQEHINNAINRLAGDIILASKYQNNATNRQILKKFLKNCKIYIN